MVEKKLNRKNLSKELHAVFKKYGEEFPHHFFWFIDIGGMATFDDNLDTKLLKSILQNLIDKEIDNHENRIPLDAEPIGIKAEDLDEIGETLRNQLKNVFDLHKKQFPFNFVVSITRDKRMIFTSNMMTNHVNAAIIQLYEQLNDKIGPDIN